MSRSRPRGGGDAGALDLAEDGGEPADVVRMAAKVLGHDLAWWFLMMPRESASLIRNLLCHVGPLHRAYDVPVGNRHHYSRCRRIRDRFVNCLLTLAAKTAEGDRNVMPSSTWYLLIL